MKKNLQYRIEALGLKLFFGLLRLLSLDAASALGGWLGRRIGPRLKAHRTAQQNLARFLPERSPDERNVILQNMWDNLGRVAAELAHHHNPVLTRRIEIIGGEYMPKPGAPVFFFSGHVGNWELLAYVAYAHGVPITSVYRKSNNPYVDDMIADIRSTWARNMFPKGPAGAVKMARAIKNGEAIAMLVDQKMNDGIPVPFFGIHAMTAPALAQLALRYDLPIIPARVVRTSGAHFRSFTYPPLDIERTGNIERDAEKIMCTVNAILESWIREHPEQWFWVHQRWPRP
ncbi:MAG: lauroyl acyltransferase [Alphaproteobacteria bacterium]